MSELIVADTEPRVQYLADGAQTEFTFPFPVLSSGDLQVLLDDAIQSEGYTVSGLGQSAGGTVSLTSAPAAGTRVTLLRRMTIARTTDFIEAGEFRASALNDELDRLTLMLQEVDGLAGRALRISPSDEPTVLVLPPRADRAGRVLAFDAEGHPSVTAEPAAAAASAAVASAAAAASEAAANAARQAAEAAAQDAATSAGTASAGATNAAASAAGAEAWADSAEDTEIEPGRFSARHWAAKAAVLSATVTDWRRNDLTLLRLRQAAAVPAVPSLPVWGVDFRFGLGLDTIVVTRASQGCYFDATGALRMAAPDELRLDHDPVTGQPLGALVEDSRTNLLHDSFNPASQTRTLASGTYCLTVLGEGSCTLGGGASGVAIQESPVTFTLAAAASVSFTVAGGLAAFQCEAGEIPTSFIETPPGGTASRAADVITLPIPGWPGKTGNSFLVDACLRRVPTTGALRLLSLDDGTDSNRHNLFWNGGNGHLLLFTKAASVSQGSISAQLGGWLDGESHVVGLSLSGGERALYANGAKGESGTVAAPENLTTLRLGSYHAGNQWNGHIRRVSAFPERLGDAEMLALTAWRN